MHMQQVKEKQHQNVARHVAEHEVQRFGICRPQKPEDRLAGGFADGEDRDEHKRGVIAPERATAIEAEHEADDGDIADKDGSRHGEPEHGDLPADQLRAGVALIEQGVNADGDDQKAQERGIQNIVRGRISAYPEACPEGGFYLGIRNSRRDITHRLPTLPHSQPGVRKSFHPPTAFTNQRYRFGPKRRAFCHSARDRGEIRAMSRGKNHRSPPQKAVYVYRKQ